MLDDRSYMQSSRMERRPVTLTLLVVLIGFYLIQSALVLYGQHPHELEEFFGLSLHGIRDGRIWQLLSFQFLQDAPRPFHLLLNCVGLYFFGRAVEDALGQMGVLRLYFMSGFFGALVQLLATGLLPNHADFPLLGASAGVLGLLAAYANLFPMREVTVFVFVFPITLRAQYLFWIPLIFSIYGTAVPFFNVAHGAHLGGILVGWAYIRWGMHSTRRFNWRPFQIRQRKHELVKAASVGAPRWARPKNRSFDDVPPDEFISREVDPILDKISAHGIQSLTPREREILEAARAKMEKR